MTLPKVSVPLLCAIWLLPVLPAQSPLTSPPGLLSVEGAGTTAFALGSHPGGRYVLMDGELQGNAQLFKSVATRADYRLHQAGSSQGRSWSKVVLDVYEGDHDGHGRLSRSRSFAGIPLSTPSQVFSASVVWPTLSSRPGQQPAAFSYRFPFRSAWAYSGSRDLCLDWRFAGGQLQNSAAWAAGLGRSYYLDAPSGSTGYATGKETRYGNWGSNKGCIDPASAMQTGAYASTLITSYNDQFDYKPYRNSIRISLLSYFTAPGKPVLIAAGPKGNHSGIQFAGVTCNKLHLDTTRPFAILPQLASLSTGRSVTFLSSLPYSSAAVGISLFCQAGWADSVSGALKLSSGSSAPAPKQPAPSFKRRSVYAADGSQSSGLLSNNPELMPVVEFGR